MPLSLMLAQANGEDDAFLVFLIAGICGFYLVLLVIGIFFLLTLSKALGRCHPHNRTMEPGMVWLNLIPLFQIVWMFITALRVAESLDNEFDERGWHRRNDDYGKTLGIVTCSLLLGGNMGYCGLPFLIAWLVCWIIYWVKISGYSTQLASRAYERYDDYDDDYDDDREERRDRRKREQDRDDDYDDRDDDRRPWDRDRR